MMMYNNTEAGKKLDFLFFKQHKIFILLCNDPKNGNVIFYVFASQFVFG